MMTTWYRLIPAALFLTLFSLFFPSAHAAAQGIAEPETLELDAAASVTLMKLTYWPKQFWNEKGEITKIVLMSVAVAIAYGLINDLVTTRLCFDYFSHKQLTHHGKATENLSPFIARSGSPLLYALLWGVIATWWMGLILGTAVALTARLGEKKKIGWSELMKPAALMVTSALALSFFAGFIAYLFSNNDQITMTSSDPGDGGMDFTYSHQPRLYHSVATIHECGYLFNLVGALLLVAHTIRKRFRLMTSQKVDDSSGH